jgi:hypothetical protein
MMMVSASHELDLSEREVRRLLESMRTDGAASISVEHLTASLEVKRILRVSRSQHLASTAQISVDCFRTHAWV